MLWSYAWQMYELIWAEQPLLNPHWWHFAFPSTSLFSKVNQVLSSRTCKVILPLYIILCVWIKNILLMHSNDTILRRQWQLYIYLLLRQNTEAAGHILFIYRLPHKHPCLPLHQIFFTLCFMSALLCKYQYTDLSNSCSVSWPHVMCLILYLRSSLHLMCSETSFLSGVIMLKICFTPSILWYVMQYCIRAIWCFMLVNTSRENWRTVLHPDLYYQNLGFEGLQFCTSVGLLLRFQISDKYFIYYALIGKTFSDNKIMKSIYCMAQLMFCLDDSSPNNLRICCCYSLVMFFLQLLE
jgi:hypothetical protein